MVNLLRWMGGLACLCLGLALLTADAQQVLPPVGPPTAIACAYNTSPPTVASGNAIWVQCDTNGRLITTTSSGSTTANQGTPNTAANAWPVKLTDGTNTTAVKAASTAPVATDPAAVVAISPNSSGLITTGTAGSPASQVVTVQGIASGTGLNFASQYPAGAVAITGNGTGTTGAVVGTLAASASIKTYICGFNVSATGGVATLGPIVVAGLVGSSQTYQLFSTATGAQLPVTFNPCIPSSAINTAITITTTADATASAVDVNSWGYQL